MKKLSKRRLLLLGIIGFLFVCISIISVYINNLSNKIDRVTINREDVINTGKEVPEEANDIITIALFGSDYSDYYDVSSADTTMILAIDTKNNKIKLCSLMRDIYLNLPEGGKMNLNYTILNGGPSSILKTINYNFNLNIDKFVQVDLKRLPKIIDSLGGVEINVTSEEISYLNKYIDHIDNKNGTKTTHINNSGLQLLNGTQASAYCRIRATAGRDFKRTERQRDVLSALFVKFKNISLSEVPGLVNEILPLVTTNLTNSEILSISTKALGLGISNIEQGRFPSDENITNIETTDMYHINIDIDATTSEIHKFLFSIEN
ncbi:MAG: LCP family protein [Clostridium sp.]|nr:LCP family protein [Clostridium sp.]